jgi:hypothetical protein
MTVTSQKLTPGQIILRHQSEAPVDVKGIANELGINVWEMTLPEGISGKIFKDRLNGGESGFSIGVQRTDWYLRKRFTVAHEIAHFILHRDRIGDELSDDAMYRSGLSTREEVEANRLAADILMPAQLVLKLKTEGCDSPEKMAKALQVSEEAMRIRLSYL